VLLLQQPEFRFGRAEAFGPALRSVVSRLRRLDAAARLSSASRKVLTSAPSLLSSASRSSRSLIVAA
jgi:hypothetical protein